VWTQRPRRLVAWTEDGRASVLDAVSGRRLRLVDAGLGKPPLGSVTSSHGSQLLAWMRKAGDSPVWRTWDLRTGTVVSTHREEGGDGGSFGPHGRAVLWNGTGVVSVYDVGTDRQLASRPLAAAAVSPTGLVAGSSADGRLGFYRLRSLRPIGRSLPGTPGVVQQFAFSRDGRLLAARTGDGSVRLVDLDGHIQLGEPISLDVSGDASIALSPDGHRLAQPSTHGIVEWDLRPGRWQVAACHLAGRDLTRDEWRTYLSPVGSYRPVCPVPARPSNAPAST